MVGSVPVGGDAPISVQSMTTTKTGRRRGHARSRSTPSPAPAPTSCAAPATRRRRPRAWPRSCPARRCRSSPTSTTSTRWPSPRSRPACTACASTRATSASPSTSRSSPRRAATAASRSASASTAARSTRSCTRSTAARSPPRPWSSPRSASCAYFDEVGFDDVKISVKASNVPLMIEAYRLLSETVDYPLHLGVTEAGPPPAGLVKATAGIATLLAEGIGDTIRYSLTADPVEEARAGRQLLEALGLRERKGLDLIACPSCGRAEVDVIAVANEAQDALEDLNIPIQVAVMGCVVNGPGEAREADLGIAAGRKRGHLFVQGQGRQGRPRGRDGRRARRVGRASSPRTGVEAALGRKPTPAPPPRPRRTAPSCSTSRAPTPTTPRPRSRSSASSSTATTDRGDVAGRRAARAAHAKVVVGGREAGKRAQRCTGSLDSGRDPRSCPLHGARPRPCVWRRSRSSWCSWRCSGWPRPARRRTRRSPSRRPPNLPSPSRRPPSPRSPSRP